MASLTAEEHEMSRYSKHLEGAEKMGILAGEGSDVPWSPQRPRILWAARAAA